jgi:serine/threonine protein kinase
MSKDVAQPYEFKDTYQFRFTRKIADGGMGSIYEAHLFGSEGFEKTVTIKTIREKFTGDRDFVDMFIGEAKLVADLVHQNIVQIYKLGRIGNQYYIAMEFVNGINLQEFLNRHIELGPRSRSSWARSSSRASAAASNTPTRSATSTARRWASSTATSPPRT